MSRFSTKQQRGREFSAMYAIMSLMQIIGPMIGGFLSAVLGIEAIFVISSLIYFCSAVPLFWSVEKFTPKPYKFRDTIDMYKKFPRRFLGYFGFGEELFGTNNMANFSFSLLSITTKTPELS